MNRSLEALAIFTICLGGILAAVRISTKDQAAESRAVAKKPAAPEKNVPAKSSSSAVDVRSEWDGGCLAYDTDYDPDYAHGCGRDRQTGEVYSPFSPLVSPSEFARRAIRSEPLPLIVLPEEERDERLDDDRLETSRTGYDAIYDAAVYGEVVAAERPDYRQIEAEYAAAELAAAEAERSVGTFDVALHSASEPLSFEAWHALAGQLHSLREGMSTQLAHYQQAYAAPAWRAVEMRWNEQVVPRLLDHPQSPSAARKHLLRRQRAEVSPAPSVDWNAYLAFANRTLASPQKPTDVTQFGGKLTNEVVQQSTAFLAGACNLAEYWLHGAGQRLQRVARQEADDSIWSVR